MEIVKGDSIYAGVKEENGNIVCENCGAEDGLTLTMHLDATDYYISNYRCKCGNIISIKTERDEASKMLWS